jgi:hypothetical protein
MFQHGSQVLPQNGEGIPIFEEHASLPKIIHVQVFDEVGSFVRKL